MNIFILYEDQELAAVYQCDKHVVKMVLESAQMLCAAFPAGEAPYRRTHLNHPCTVWSRTCRTNYEWLLVHAEALADEYTRRYGKTHKSAAVIDWCREHADEIDFTELDTDYLTPFAQAMPDEYRHPDPVTAYRRYYREGKASIAKWDRCPDGRPEWI